MNAQAIIEALGLPPESRINQRVPKKLLVENGAPTVSDKRQINEGIEELLWLAVLKPNTVGVPSYSDETRQYLEITVLSLKLRPMAKAVRLVELVHRAIPYPVVLVTSQSETTAMSLAHKRLSQGEAGKVVLDGSVAEVRFEPNPEIKQLGTEKTNRFLQSLTLAELPQTNLLAVYRGWMGRIFALQAAKITGNFAILQTEELVAMRQKALEEHDLLTHNITSLRSQAQRESQINRRVELNLTIKRLEDRLREVEKAL